MVAIGIETIQVTKLINIAFILSSEYKGNYICEFPFFFFKKKAQRFILKDIIWAVIIVSTELYKIV